MIYLIKLYFIFMIYLIKLYFICMIYLIKYEKTDVESIVIWIVSSIV